MKLKHALFFMSVVVAAGGCGKQEAPPPTAVAEPEAELGSPVAVEASGGNQKDAATTVGLTYDQFRHLLRKYEIKAK